MRGDQDLLVQLALEHRDLGQASRRLRRGVASSLEALRAAAVDLVDHELAHRLLVYPLLRRDARGRELFAERREEQLLLADRLRHALALAGSHASTEDSEVAAAVRGLDDQLVEHTDREEIVTFPHLRRLAVAGELAELGRLRTAIGPKIRSQLRADGPLLVDGAWATVGWRELPDLLDLSEELVIELPELTSPRAAAS